MKGECAKEKMWTGGKGGEGGGRTGGRGVERAEVEK